MCAQAIVNPEDLEHFARDLRDFNGQLRERMSQLQGGFAQLGETWRDQEHAKFAEEFQQTMRALQHFMQAADQQIPFLMKKARLARDYLEHRS